jgi:hypothetical protein
MQQKRRSGPTEAARYLALFYSLPSITTTISVTHTHLLENTILERRNSYPALSPLSLAVANTNGTRESRSSSTSGASVTSIEETNRPSGSNNR